MTNKEENPGEATFFVGDWQVDPSTLRIRRQADEIRLEPKVMDVLIYLSEHAGQVVSREQLENSVWQGTIVGYDALTSTIIKLRKALRDDSRSPRYIETIPKKGYRLLAETQSATQETNSPAQDTSLPQASHPAIPPKQVVTTGIGQQTRVKLIGIGLLLIVVVVLAQVLGRDDREPKPASHSNKISNPSIVVLPFVNLNQDPSQAYFSNGITDDLINDLSGYGNLRVIARRTAYAYKDRSINMQVIAHDLGVSYIIDGNIRRDGDRIRLNVQLIDAENDANIWAQRFDKKITDIFSVQDEIRQHIVHSLSLTLTEQEKIRTQKRYTQSFAAYDVFLKGQARLVTRASAKDNAAAQSLMESAIHYDAGFARAHAALALIYADAYRFNWSKNPEEERRLALATAQHALSLDSSSPQAHWILGYIYLFLYEDYQKAIEMAKLANKLAPYDIDAENVLAVTHVFSGDPARGKLIIQEIMQHNKHYSAMVPGVLGHANFVMGKYDEALAAYNESLLMNPARINPNVYKILVLYHLGQRDEAEFQVDQLYALHPNFNVESWAANQPFKDKQMVKQMLHELKSLGIKTAPSSKAKTF